MMNLENFLNPPEENMMNQLTHILDILWEIRAATEHAGENMDKRAFPDYAIDHFDRGRPSKLLALSYGSWISGQRALRNTIGLSG